VNLDNIRIRKYKANDEFNIFQLFSEVFDTGYSQERWAWQYKNNIYGPGWIVVAEDQNGIVGQSSTRRNHINFMGREILAGQGCDLMVKKEYRKTGISNEMIQTSISNQTQEGGKVVFSFPNRDSYPGSMRSYNDIRICYLNEYSYRIGLKKIWGQRFDQVFKMFLSLPNSLHFKKEKQIINQDIRIVSTKNVPNHVGAMLDECHNYEVLSIWKDLDYMKWRYEENPEHRYDYHTLFIDGMAEGFIVCKQGDDQITICEFISRTKNFRQSVLFLRYIIKRYFLTSAQTIEFYGWDSGFFDCIYSKSGFQKKISSLVLAVCLLDSNDERLSQMVNIPENWTVVMGDSDII